MNDFREYVEAELDPQPQTPVTDLVAGAVRQGRRMIRTRRLTAAAAVVATLAAGTATWLVARQHDSTPPAADAGVVYLPANAAAIAHALASRLPAGVELTNAYKYEKDPAAVAVYLDRGRGPGLMQFVVDNYPRTASTCLDTTDRDVVCHADPDGTLTVVARTPAVCQEDTVVERYRADGVHISVYLASCLMWDGNRAPPAPLALSVDEAVNLSADPIWATRMDAREVTDGAARYPSLALWVDE